MEVKFVHAQVHRLGYIPFRIFSGVSCLGTLLWPMAQLLPSLKITPSTP